MFTVSSWLSLLSSPVLSRLSRGPARVVDPPEEWEIPVGRDLDQQLRHGNDTRYPFRPGWLGDAPPLAVSTLRAVVGVRQSGDLFVVPPSTRLTGRGSVCSPTQVLGVGAAGAGLWVDELTGGRIVCALPDADIHLVEDSVRQFCGRLTIIGGGRLVMRYDPVSRGALAPS